MSVDTCDPISSAMSAGDGDDSKNGATSAGAIVGYVIAALVFILCIIIVFFVWKPCEGQKDNSCLSGIRVRVHWQDTKWVVSPHREWTRWKWKHLHKARMDSKPLVVRIWYDPIRAPFRMQMAI